MPKPRTALRVMFIALTLAGCGNDTYENYPELLPLDRLLVEEPAPDYRATAALQSRADALRARAEGLRKVQPAPRPDTPTAPAVDTTRPAAGTDPVAPRTEAD